MINIFTKSLISIRINIVVDGNGLEAHSDHRGYTNKMITIDKCYKKGKQMRLMEVKKEYISIQQEEKGRRGEGDEEESGRMHNVQEEKNNKITKEVSHANSIRTIEAR